MDRRNYSSEPLEGRRLLAFGTLDASFGHAGVAAAGDADTRTAAIDVLPDGRIVTARVVDGKTAGERSALWVSRFLPNGTPDPAFGGTVNGQPAGTPRGTVRVTGHRLPHTVVDVRVTKQGKVILAGTFETGSGSSDLTVVRLNANGTRDDTFGGSTRGFNGASPGVAFAGFGNTRDRARALAVRADGQIGVVGTSEKFATTSGAAAVFRTDGTFDTSFSSDGKSLWTLGGRAQNVAVNYAGTAAGFGQDGQLFVAGARSVEVLDGPARSNWEFQTVGADGVTEAGNPFAPGETRISHAFAGTVHDVAALGDGSILVAGERDGSLVVAKVLADGTIDHSFGDDGIARAPQADASMTPVKLELGRASGARIAVLPDGRFYVLAHVMNPTDGGDAQAVVIARFTSVGTPDRGFGGMHKVEAGAAVRAADLAVHGDDAIVLAAVAPPNREAPADASMRLLKVQGGAGARLTARGALEVSGTSTGDTITITRRSKDGRVVARVGETVKSFPASRVKRIQVYSEGGNDRVRIGPGVRGTFVDAGPGNDTVTGGDGDDTIIGGLGSDRLVGNNGNDAISGCGGRDYLLGSAGHDTLNGGAGIDTLSGAGGHDLLLAAADDAADSLLGGSGADRAAKDILDFFKDIEQFLTGPTD